MSPVSGSTSETGTLGAQERPSAEIQAVAASSAAPTATQPGPPAATALTKAPGGGQPSTSAHESPGSTTDVGEGVDGGAVTTGEEVGNGVASGGVATVQAAARMRVPAATVGRSRSKRGRLSCGPLILEPS